MKPIFVWAKFLKRNFCWKQRTHLWAENEPMLIRSRCFWKVSKSVKACASYLYLYISSVSRGRTKRRFCDERGQSSPERGGSEKWKWVPRDILITLVRASTKVYRSEKRKMRERRADWIIATRAKEKFCIYATETEREMKTMGSVGVFRHTRTSN